MSPEDCKNCKKEKTIYFTQIIDGKIKKFDLCAECPYALAVNDPVGFGLAEQLTAAGVHMSEQDAGTGVVCPACGFSMADLRKTGRLGCPECYVTFRIAIENILKPMHRGLQHMGRSPQHMAEEIELTTQMKSLSSDLDQAVAEENYEEAARLRDRLRAVEARLAALKGSSSIESAANVREPTP